MRPLFHLGRYLIMLSYFFRKPENWRMYVQETFRQMYAMGVGSLLIVVVISLFMGAVITLQTAYQLVSPLVPVYVVASIVRESTILELSVSVLSLVLAGKIGSSLATELGTMRISEQIDALEIMGVNSRSYLILPKLIAALITIPGLVIISCNVALFSGFLVSTATGVMSSDQFLFGLREDFVPFNVVFCMIKAVTFSFIIATVACYHGYYAEGGAYEIGAASTKAVVYCCIIILVFDYLLAQLLL